MSLLSFTYAVSVIGAAFLFHVCPARLRPALLAIVSILFYAVSSAISAGVLLIAALAVFAVARYMDQMDTASLSVGSSSLWPSSYFWRICFLSNCSRTCSLQGRFPLRLRILFWL